jgi:type IV fimbrial biogenesis protein FimT
MAMPRRGRGNKGFTLIEAMIVIAILAVLATIAAPNFRSLIATMNVKSAAFDLVNDFTTARSEAIKRNQAVTVRALTGDWVKGWEIVTGAGPTVLRTREGANMLTFSGAASVDFQPNGRIADATTLSKWEISAGVEGVMPRCIIIAPTGSARSTPGAC